MKRRSPSIHFFRGRQPIGMACALERKLLTLFEFFPHVQSVVRAPEPDDPKWKEVIKDTHLLVTFRTGEYAHQNQCWRPWLLEAHDYDPWTPTEPRLAERRLHTALYAGDQGWDFRIICKSDIDEPTLANIITLNQYRRLTFDRADRHAVRARLKREGILRIGQLVNDLTAAADPRVGTAHVWHLLATGVICCDIRRPLNTGTEVWLPGRE